MIIDINLKPEEFNQALHKGMGRAYLYIQKYGDSQVHDSLLSACLKNMVYDPQCEEGRAEWLISLIDLTGNNDFYFPKIVNALIPSIDCWKSKSQKLKVKRKKFFTASFLQIYNGLVLYTLLY